MPEMTCDRIQAAMSAAHDDHRPLEGDLDTHVAECPDCSAFSEQLLLLDDLLTRSDVSKAPNHDRPPLQTARRHRPVVIGGCGRSDRADGGAMIAGQGRVQSIQGHDLGDRLHRASPSVTGLRAGLLVVERGWHPDVPERVYTGTLSYSAPEQLALDLVDTTAYPGPDWSSNNVELAIADGESGVGGISTVSARRSARLPATAGHGRLSGPEAVRSGGGRAAGDHRAGSEPELVERPERVG